MSVAERTLLLCRPSGSLAQAAPSRAERQPRRRDRSRRQAAMGAATAERSLGTGAGAKQGDVAYASPGFSTPLI